MNDPYDQAARYAVVKLDPPGFCRWVFKSMHLRFREWLDTRTLPFPGEPDRTCDSVARLDEVRARRRWAVPVETQSTPDTEMLDRLLEYVARLRRGLRYGVGRSKKYEVAAVLLNLSGAKHPDTLDMGLPDGEGPRLLFRV